MQEIALKGREFARLKKYPLDGIVSTESEIFILKKE